MTRLRLYSRALRALWRVGFLRMGPLLALRVLWAWRRCRGSLSFLAETAALRAGARLALVDDDGPLSFRELRHRYEALAGELVTRFAAGPGRQIAILGRNHRSLVVGLLAAARTGADVLLLNPDSPPHVLANLFDVPGAAAAGAPEPLILLHEATFDVASVARGVRHRVLDAEVQSVGVVRLPRLRRAGQLCILTAGSTGLPKRVAREPTIASLLPVVCGLLDSLPVALYRPTVLGVPCFHGHGLATLAAALACLSPLHLARRYEIAPLLARPALAGPAVVASVPTLLVRWLAARPVRGQVAAVLTGSAPLDAGLCGDLLQALGPVVYNLYGSSEAGLVSLATSAMLAAAPGTVGRPLPGTELRLLDGAGRAVADGEIGRIHVRGPLVVRPGADGWLDTGDLGRVDAAGCLHVCGRADGMFISGGENVYPQVVEACLREHPVVAEAAIAVVPDAEFGARMRAFVVARAGVKVSVDDVRTWLCQRLDRHQQPKRIDVVEALPQNVLGKLDRPALALLVERDLA
jgi:acyl-CoA synthetase (AMP-forming)/AMP-acid ligase II